MTVLTEVAHDGGFLVSEANKTRSREKAIVVSGSLVVKPGTVLGRVATGAASSAVKASGANTGNGTMGTVTPDAASQPGVYKLRVTKVVANAGDFEVIDPQGDVVGIGAVGTAFNAGGLSFTLADGSTDFVVGDGFDITIAAGSGKYAPLTVAGTTGIEDAVAILFGGVDATSADQVCTIVAREAEVNAEELVWPAGITSDQKNAAIAALNNQQIFLR